MSTRETQPFEEVAAHSTSDVPGGKGYATTAPEPKVSAQPLACKYTLRINKTALVVAGVPGTAAFSKKFTLSELSKDDSTLEALGQNYEEYEISAAIMEVVSVGPMATTSGAFGVTMIGDPTVEPPTSSEEILALAARRSETITVSAKQSSRVELDIHNGVFPSKRRFTSPPAAGGDPTLRGYGTMIMYTASPPVGADAPVCNVWLTVQFTFYKPTRTPTTTVLTTPEVKLTVTKAEHTNVRNGEHIQLTCTVTDPAKDKVGDFIALPADTVTFVLREEKGESLVIRESVTVTVSQGNFAASAENATLMIPLPKARSIIVRDPDGVEFPTGLTFTGYIAYHEETPAGNANRIITSSSQTLNSTVMALNAFDWPSKIVGEVLASRTKARETRVSGPNPEVRIGTRALFQPHLDAEVRLAPSTQYPVPRPREI